MLGAAEGVGGRGGMTSAKAPAMELLRKASWSQPI